MFIYWVNLNKVYHQYPSLDRWGNLKQQTKPLQNLFKNHYISPFKQNVKHYTEAHTCVHTIKQARVLVSDPQGTLEMMLQDIAFKKPTLKLYIWTTKTLRHTGY